MYVPPTWTSLGRYDQYSYDTLSRLTETSTMSGATEQWDTTTNYTHPDPWAWSESDPNDNTTSYLRDGHANLATVTDALGSQVTYGYDQFNRLTEVDGSMRI